MRVNLNMEKIIQELISQMEEQEEAKIYYLLEKTA